MPWLVFCAFIGLVISIVALVQVTVPLVAWVIATYGTLAVALGAVMGMAVFGFAFVTGWLFVKGEWDAAKTNRDG